MNETEDQADPGLQEAAEHPHAVEDVRLDKWLWAARLFKTRAIAKDAVESGRVRYRGARAKVGRNVEVGALMAVRQGWDEWEIEVLGLSDRRLGAPQARLLYRETDESRRRREQAAEQRRLAASGLISDERPTKKQRRAIHRFKRGD